MRVQCYMIEPTRQIKRSLRRYCPSDKDTCSTRYKYHNAQVDLDIIESDNEDDTIIADKWPHDDPRWPTHCECGYRFQDDDRWQLFTETIWRRPDTGEEGMIDSFSGGAMWYADWTGLRGPDGHSLCVKCPDGQEWLVDYPSRNGPGWTREGTPPYITARPSILTYKTENGCLVESYHGFLTNGVLESV